MLLELEIFAMIPFEEKYQAIVRKDPSYEGIFITAVKTTGIFCRPVCTARKPKPENVQFFDTAREALLHGYRPCKVCKPLEAQGETPPYIQALLDELHQYPDRKLRDYDLRQRNIEPSQLRRWFKKNHQLTFQAYQRMLRINGAYARISGGETVTNTAFDSGFESLSGFAERFQSVFGQTPSKAGETTVINIVRFTTPLGPMFACATQKGLCLLEFTDRRMLETEFKALCKLLKAVILPGPNKHLEQVQQELSEYFAGTRKSFSIALHTPGSPFQQSVWEVLQEIPYGQTRSYKQQALRLNKPLAVRAVASANGCNRVALVVPCHRVIGESGGLVGYAGGLSRKQWLLDFEKAHAPQESVLQESSHRAL